ncbi:MAG: tryptophan synthase subunit alpha [Candidatus Melainabacteria bacterium]|nr:MAG: tryptophan synthase subunit alpha [Candidatus Melainabacteria bacterium]
MSRRYEERFKQLGKLGKKAFIPFTLLGWPNREESLKMIKEMIECEASALELGIAFSDPVADGPVIQKAAYETIASGFSVHDAFELITEVRKLDGSIPIGILVYFNTVLAKGIGSFFSLAKESGVDGILIADLPAENAQEVLPAAETNGIDLIFLVSPVTTPNRLDIILSRASGFLYLVSRLGVTGTMERSTAKDLELRALVDKIRKRSRVPVCAGFGISSQADAERMFEIGVDGVITGSRVIQLAQSSSSCSSGVLKQYFKEMVGASARSNRYEHCDS